MLRLKPRRATVYLITLSKLFLEQLALSAGIPSLHWQQDDQEQQHIPAMYGKRDPTNSSQTFKESE